MNQKNFPCPPACFLKTDDEEKFLPFQNPTTYKDITVELKPNGEALLRIRHLRHIARAARHALFRGPAARKSAGFRRCLGARLRRL